MTSRKKIILYIIIAIVVTAFVATVAIIYHNINPLESHLFPKCYFYVLTGYQCPGCGAQRAFHYFLNGEIVKAFKQNPFVFLATIYFIIILVLKSTFCFPKCQKIYYSITGNWACIFWFVFVISFWILRNLI